MTNAVDSALSSADEANSIELAHPSVSLSRLDELWFQVTGTRCNLTCTHCFISCSPENNTFGSLDIDSIKPHLDASRGLGVKEYYFTGGEPFLHPQIVEIIALTLSYGPVTVLTNGTVMTPTLVNALSVAAQDALYSLEFRVSLDHFDAALNDTIRGAGSYRLAMRGLSRLASGGFLPIVTAMRTWELDQDLEIIEQLGHALRAIGVGKPRIKILPSLKLGAELERSGSYESCDFVTTDMMVDYPVEQLLCTHSRIITDRGVHVCPILIEAPDALLGQTLADAHPEFELKHQACSTCYLFGAFCTNPGPMIAEAKPVNIKPRAIPTAHEVAQ
jgi:AdoMet-dependent heme synthase